MGGLDAIVDIVGTCAALETLGVDRVCATPVATGTGMVRSAHGVLPNPAPAVVDLLRGAPTYGRDIAYELTTPTGAAILAANGRLRPAPGHDHRGHRVRRRRRDLDDLPNMTQVVLGTSVADLSPGQPVVLLEVNVDDATGETLAHTVAALLEAGAHDAWVTPIVMKKGRPAHTVSALADVALADQLSKVLVAETGSLGVRGQTFERGPRRNGPRGRGGRVAGAREGQRWKGEGRARRRGPRHAPAPVCPSVRSCSRRGGVAPTPTRGTTDPDEAG